MMMMMMTIIIISMIQTTINFSHKQTENSYKKQNNVQRCLSHTHTHRVNIKIYSSLFSFLSLLIYISWCNHHHRAPSSSSSYPYPIVSILIISIVLPVYIWLWIVKCDRKIYLYNTWLFNKSNKNWMCLSNTKKSKQTKQNIVSNSYVCK